VQANMECNALSAVHVTHHFLKKMVSASAACHKPHAEWWSRAVMEIYGNLVVYCNAPSSGSLMGCTYRSLMHRLCFTENALNVFPMQDCHFKSSYNMLECHGLLAYSSSGCCAQ